MELPVLEVKTEGMGWNDVQPVIGVGDGRGKG